MSEVIALLKELIGINSTNPGVREGGVAALLEQKLRSSGAEVILEPVADGRSNVIARIPGIGDTALVLTGHMDTVVEGSGWTRPAFEATEEDGRIYGRGSCDMKAGLACAVSLVCRTAELVRKKQLVLNMPLVLICTVDEEAFMQGIEQAIRDGYVHTQDWVLDLEPTDAQIQMAHKGRFWLEMDFAGVTAHASHPEEGVDAIAAAGMFIHMVHDYFAATPVHPELGPSTVTFGQIAGGYQPYVVPDECKLWMDMRLSPPLNDEIVLKEVDRVCDAVRTVFPGIQIGRTITGNRPWIERNNASPCLKALKEAVRQVTGREAEVTAFFGYTDTAVVAGMTGCRNTLSYGPGNLICAHKPDEYVQIQDVERCEKVYAELIRAACLPEGSWE